MKSLLATLSLCAALLFPVDLLAESTFTIEVPGHPNLGLEIKKNKVVAQFLGEDGEASETTAESIIFVVDDPGHRNDEWRTVLRPGEDGAFTSSRSLFPPHKFRARLIIRFTDGEPVSLPNLKIDLQKK